MRQRLRVGTKFNEGWLYTYDLGTSLTRRVEYVTKYASKEAADEAGAESDDDDDMSSVGSFGDEDDDEPAGQMEEV